MNKRSNVNDTPQRHAVPPPPMLFDLDGTLVGSAYQHVLAWHETFTDFRLDIPNWKIHRRIGMSGSFFLSPLLREIGHSTNPAVIKRLEKSHAKYFTRRIKPSASSPARANSCNPFPKSACLGPSPLVVSVLKPKSL